MAELFALARNADRGLVFLLGFLLWLLNHPYQGIWHDARIYGLLAAHWLNPQALAADLFFSFGSQGELSLFTPLFGELVRGLGLSRAAWWVVISGGLLWIGACSALARTVLGTGFAARFAVLLGAVMVMSYSPNASTFILGENFATARSWAIPVGLASVAALAAKRQEWSLGLSLVAVALHPLHGVWPLVLWVLVRMRTRAALTLALLPVAVVVVLGVMKPDLPGLRLMAGDWFEFVRAAPDIVFKPPLQTRLPIYSGVLMVLWLGARHGSEEWRPVYLRLLLLGVSGLGLALLASYAFPVEIVVQGQPWRVMALLIPLAAMAMIDVGRCAWQSPAAGRLLVGGVAVVASMGSYWLPGALCGIGVMSLLPGDWIDRIEAWVGHWRRWLWGALVVLALVVLPNVLARWEIAGTQFVNPWLNPLPTGTEWLHGLVAGGSWHLAVVLALVLGRLGGDNSAGAWAKRLIPTATLVLLVLVGLMTLAAVYNWDRRSEQSQTTQACYLDASCSPHPFRQWISPGSSVFWVGNELIVWFELVTASYFGDLQATGRVFSSVKFYEWERRKAWVAKGNDPRHLCADPIVDWVVLPQAAPGLSPRAAWRGSQLYSCANLRAVSPAPTSSPPLRDAA